MLELLSKLCRVSFQPFRVVVNDLEFFNKTWKANEIEAKKELGKFANAAKTLREIEAIIDGKGCHERKTPFGLLRHQCKDEDLHRDILPLIEQLERSPEMTGDPKHVSHIIPPCNSIGYAIYTNSKTDISCEVVESLYKQIKILRRKERIIVIQPYGMMRNEIYRNCHVC